MGCDIHCVIEYKHEDFNNPNSWDSFGFNSINPGRNYDLFANLAGVRGSPKGGETLASGFGIPDNASWATKYETTVAVNDTNRAEIEGWVARGISKWVGWVQDLHGKPTRVTHPDWHTHGWADIKRWKKAVKGSKNLQIKCMNAIMDTLAKNGCEVRVVFWFDN